MAILAIPLGAVVAWLLVSLLIYCLRMGVVGGRGTDAHRDKHPIRYWIGIGGLAFGAAFLIGGLLYVLGSALLHLLWSNVA